MSKVYGYVLLPVAFERGRGQATEESERLWEAGEYDLTGRVEHYHEDGGWAPLFIEAGSDYEAQDIIAAMAAGRREA
jgi:hypothetical protein